MTKGMASLRVVVLFLVLLPFLLPIGPLLLLLVFLYLPLPVFQLPPLLKVLLCLILAAVHARLELVADQTQLECLMGLENQVPLTLSVQSRLPFAIGLLLLLQMLLILVLVLLLLTYALLLETVQACQQPVLSMVHELPERLAAGKLLMLFLDDGLLELPLAGVLQGQLLSGKLRKLFLGGGLWELLLAGELLLLADLVGKDVSPW
jgi:hypothetical protein